MELPIYTVDAFTTHPFEGNPAAVCIIKHDQDVDPSIMQSIAKEMNLSETAFVQLLNPSVESVDKVFGLRWFTPTIEVNLCGHATLASAAVLFHHYAHLCDHLVKFKTLSGILTAKNEHGQITLDLPLADCTSQVSKTADSVIQKVLLEFNSSIQTSHVKAYYSPMTKKLLIRLPDECSRSQLESFPVPEASNLLKTHDGTDIKGVIVTVLGGGADKDKRPYDFVSRYFAPWVGIPEDPVTGSAHTVLGKYWSEVLSTPHLYARQCSSRGGNLLLTVDEKSGRLFVAGKACIVLTGKFILP
ncbi:PBLD [Bugula neritina]|uniref:PBLD n=1 Tax=Bugula neritina TaxID=10212 RepID=A0A7J7J1I4_BUGNE|nr:PBLD [Bugula neritina]